jgi:exopolysaccharide production protein ExoY
MVSVARADVEPHFDAAAFSASRVYPGVKRILDVVIAIGLGAVLFLPLFLVVAPLLRLGGPVFYCQTRIGAGGRRFRCHKFRTMVPNADRRLACVLAADAEAREQWRRYYKLSNDPRVTRIGRILRSSSLDELPQLWNVLKGDMSLVGPRPIVEDEVSRYGRYFQHYAAVRPGLTGAWQVFGRNTTVEYRRRVAMDVWYVQHHCFWVDCLLLTRTAHAVIGGKGV